MTPRRYDRDGNEITEEQAAELAFNAGYERVALTLITDCADPEKGWHVSTVWVGGHDLSFGRGRPKLFESMAFPLSEDEEAEICQRYETEMEAIAGHVAMVAELAKTLGDPLVIDRPLNKESHT